MRRDIKKKLFQAVYHQNMSLLSYWLREFAVDQIIDTDNMEHKTLLMASTELESPLMLNFLINKGANIHYMTPDGRDSALFWCCRWGTAECFEWIVQYLKSHGGFDINMVNSDGNSPLLLATMCGNHEVLSKLIEHKPKMDLLNNSNQGVFDLLSRSTLSNKEELYELICEHLANNYIEMLKNRAR